MMKAAKNTWNFLKQLATLAHGCASETHLSMDANMRRLPKESIIYMEILSVPCSLYVVSVSGRLRRYPDKTEISSSTINKETNEEILL